MSSPIFEVFLVSCDFSVPNQFQVTIPFFKSIESPKNPYSTQSANGDSGTFLGAVISRPMLANVYPDL